MPVGPIVTNVPGVATLNVINVFAVGALVQFAYAIPPPPPGVAVGVAVAVPVDVGVGVAGVPVGVAVGVPPPAHGKPVIESTLTPTPATLLSVAILHFSLMLWPLAAAG